jgi:hypothetical protein
MPHSTGIGAIFGIVSENGIAKSGARVGLYDRSTMGLIRTTTADALGGYMFNGLNQTSSDYLVMALDDDGSPAKNALVQDYIQPISAHMGATAYCNWYALAMQKDPYVVWEPRYVSSIPVLMAPTHMTSFTTGTFSPDQATLTPGAPDVPSVLFTTGTTFIPARTRSTTNAPDGTTTTYSMEFVIDTTTSTAVIGLRCNDATDNGVVSSSNAYGALGAEWVRSTKQIKIYLSKDWVGFNTWFWNLLHGNWVGDGGPYTYTDAGLSDGAHHFVITVQMGVTMKLYVDGAHVFTQSLVGKEATHGTPQGGLTPGIAGIYLATASGGSTTGRYGPLAWYKSILTDPEVTALYNALMVGSTPVVTGYVRDVVTDRPGVLVRCDAATVSTTAETEYLSRSTLGHYGTTITVQQASPVTGGVMTLFNGGVLHGLGPGGPLCKTQNTIEFWINPDTAAPPATRTIMCGRRADDSTFNWKIQQVITTGKISITVRKSTDADETVAFNYAPPASTDTLIAITLDKVNGSAKIYANGVLQDTQSLLVGYFWNYAGYDDRAESSQYLNRILQVGGLRHSNGTLSEQFYGKISEIAVYLHLVGVDRLLSHYNARTLT